MWWDQSPEQIIRSHITNGRLENGSPELLTLRPVDLILDTYNQNCPFIFLFCLKSAWMGTKLIKYGYKPIGIWPGKKSFFKYNQLPSENSFQKELFHKIIKSMCLFCRNRKKNPPFIERCYSRVPFLQKFSSCISV